MSTLRWYASMVLCLWAAIDASALGLAYMRGLALDRDRCIVLAIELIALLVVRNWDSHFARDVR